jgi:hypothetical protein
VVSPRKFKKDFLFLPASGTNLMGPYNLNCVHYKLPYLKLHKVRLPVEQRNCNEVAPAKVKAIMISRSWTCRLLKEK